MNDNLAKMAKTGIADNRGINWRYHEIFGLCIKESQKFLMFASQKVSAISKRPEFFVRL